jgi:uncharacterized protein
VFGMTGVATSKVVAIALVIGISTFPGAFVARWMIARLPLHVHTAMLDAVVGLGGAAMIINALRL